jgi:CGNR zinc finger
VLVDDDDPGLLRRALDAAGMAIADEREVLVVDVVDRPGSLGEPTRRLAAAHVNVDLAYATFGGVRLVIATDDLRGARAALEAAMAFVDVVRGKELSRLRICAADDCESVVVDLSKNRSKRFCEGGCGNRAAVAAYRARKAKKS